MIDPDAIPNLWLRPRAAKAPVVSDGTVTPYKVGDAVNEALQAAARLRTGRRVYAPATTVEGALVDVEGYCVMPEWYEDAAELARETLRALYQLDAADNPARWTLYAEAARWLGVPGVLPVAHIGDAEAARA